MQFLILNGINIPIVMNQCTRGEDKIQDVTRSFGGQLRNAARGYRRTWEATALFQDFDVADGFINLINGEGHYWSLGEGSTSATGMSIVPGYAGRGMLDSGTAVTNGFSFSGTGGDYWSTGCLHLYGSLPDEFIDCFAWDCQLEDDKWTAVLIIENEDLPTGKFEPLVFRSDGKNYLNGVSMSYQVLNTDTVKYLSIGNISYSARVRNGIFYLSLGFAATEDIRISDLVIVPYVMPDYFIQQLSIDGDDITSEDHPSVPVTGEVTSVAYMQKPGSNNAKTVAFKLTEYLPGYKYDPEVPNPVSPFSLPVLRLGGSVLSVGEGELTRYPEASP
jgi:hypothetical protein